MVYAAPTITAAGLVFSSYQDAEDYLVSEAQRIFGADILLDNSSQDFHFIASQAQLMYDNGLALQLAINSTSVAKATGTILDGLVANNGLVRMQATKSLVTVNLTGTPFTVINNATVGDTNGNQWILPTVVTLDASGLASVTATAQNFGPVTAPAGTVTQIQTPTAGWTSVTNANAASPGRDIESDSELKTRQAVATQGPTQTVLGGILSAIRNLPLVTAAQVYENDTNGSLTSLNGVTNSAGFPAHSLTLVVEGGSDSAIGAAYGLRKPPGSLTNGTTTFNYVDPAGVITPIRFYRPTLNPLDVTITVKPLAGYSDAVRDIGKQAISDYLNSLPAGSTIIISELFQVLANSDTKNTMSIKLITVGNSGGSQFNNDASLAFNRKPTATTANITWLFPT